MINERLKALRKLMLKNKIDLYIIPTSDYHGSEYEGVFFRAREFMSGFTGSAGTLIVTMEEAVLYTDGRYFIQAENELVGSEIILYRDGEPMVPGINEYVFSKISSKDTIGFDGRVMSAKTGISFEKAKVRHDLDLVDIIWSNRPELILSEPWILKEEYAGASVAVKIFDLRNHMKKRGADFNILSSLDDIAWLYNIRGSDIPNNPVVFSYALVTEKEAFLFLNLEHVNEDLKNYFNDNDIRLMEYNLIWNYINKKIRKSSKILLDLNKINYSLYKCIPNGVNLDDAHNPTTIMKAVKNSIEIENIKKAHIKDGVCVTKFIYWLKSNVGKERITETSAADYLYNLRKSMDGFIEESFKTISAYNENAAMMHYSPYDNAEVELKKKGLLLIDSGGHYFEGTTDVTRTIVLGVITQEMKVHYTAVVKSMLKLAGLKFLYGCNGLNLDVIARSPIWELGIDYKCGTGHGIGYLLNVHEGPNSFRWKNNGDRLAVPFEAGMITTDEPGIYIKGSHGIRIENELLCVENEENEFGKFMSFETITFVPIDIDGIDVSYLEEKDLKALKNYNEMVMERISPYLTEQEVSYFNKNLKSQGDIEG